MAQLSGMVAMPLVPELGRLSPVDLYEFKVESVLQSLSLQLQDKVSYIG